MKQIIKTITIIAGLLLLLACTPHSTPAPADAPPLADAWHKPPSAPAPLQSQSAIASAPHSSEPTDLGLQITASATAAQTAVYTLTVTNHGPAIAANIALTNNLPSGASLAWYSPRQAACKLGGAETPGELHCDVGHLKGGDSVTVTLDADAGDLTVQSPAPSCAPTPDGSALACRLGALPSGASIDVQLAANIYAPLTRTITNTATLAAANPDPSPANNTRAAALTIAPAQTLTSTQEHTDTNLAVWTDAPAHIIAGQPFSYTLTVANNSPQDASSVMLHDILPPGIIIHATNPGRPSCALAENSVTCYLDDAQGQQDIKFTLVVLSDVTSSPEIALDPLDPGWPLCEIETGGKLSRAVHCSLGDLQSGQKTRVTLLASANGIITRVITNTISARAQENDSDLQDNSHRLCSIVGLQTDLNVQSRASGPALSSQTFTYTLHITNHGPSDARHVLLTDTLPTGVSALKAIAQTGGNCTIDQSLVTCRLPQLASGQSALVTILANVNAQPGQSITNTVLVAAPAPDPDPGNNQASQSLSVGPHTTDD